jgi:hypothetical protein
MSYLLAAGDSWTDYKFKSVIDPNVDCSFTKWPELLGVKMGIDKVVNVGKSGAANNYIFEKCYNSIVKNIKNPPKVVCLLLTRWDRVSVFDYNLDVYNKLTIKNMERLGKLPPNKLHWHEMVTKTPGRFAFIEDLWSNHLTIENIVDNTLRDIWLFQTFCNTHNIKCVIIHGLKPLRWTREWDSELYNHIRQSANDERLSKVVNYIKYMTESPYFSQLDTETLPGLPFFHELGGWDIESDWLENHCHEYMLIPGVDRHPNGLGHQEIANIFYRECNQIYGKII